MHDLSLMKVISGRGNCCPFCGRFMKQYRRCITSGMAYTLILIYKYYRGKNTDFIHIRQFLKDLPGVPCSFDGDFSKLRFWGLLEKKEGNKEDGNPDNGFYRITEKGKLFVEDKIRVSPKYFLTYNNEIIGEAGEAVSIKECLKNKFDYFKLMNDLN